MYDASRLRRAMDARGFGRGDLVRATGFSYGAVTAWFTGERRPTVDKLCRICEVLGVSADYLLGLAGDAR